MNYSVLLESCGNIDYGQNPNMALDGVPTKREGAPSIEECQHLVKKYIDEYNLGGGNWAGGEVCGDNGDVIGHISYNGRYWTKEAWNKLWS